MHAAATTLVTKAIAIVRYAESLGIERGRLLASAGIAPELLERGDGRIASRAIATLWTDLGRWTGDADHGLRLAEAEDNARPFGVVGFRAMTSETLGEGLACFARFIRIVNEDARAGLVDGPAAVRFELALPAPNATARRSMTDRALASSLLLARRWTGLPLQATRVQFRHEKPRDTSGYERVFACKVDYAQPVDAIDFDRPVMGLPLRTAQSEVASYLDTLARSAEVDLPTEDAGGAVAHAVRASLDRGDPGLRVVARRLGVSGRTLQRRLASAGLSYHRIVDQVRRELAVRLVTSTALPLTLISERAGYAEEKAFRRAFRRWTGCSPSEIRRRR